MKEKTYTAYGILNIINDMGLDFHIMDGTTMFLFDDKNKKHADVVKISGNEYVISEWKPYTYANSIGV